MSPKQPIKQKIVIDDQFTLNTLQKEVANGGRFIVFSYTISLIFAITLKRFSPAFFFKKDDSIVTKQSKYNRINYLFGWWCFPYGPSCTLQSLKTNNKGGIDVTEDILLNINEQSLFLKEVDLIFTNMLFKHPDQNDLKEFQSIIRNPKSQQLLIQKLIVGLYINVKENQDTYFVIGIKTNANFTEQVEQFRSLCYTKFYKSVRFDFIDFSKESEINSKLEKQGFLLIG